MNEDRKLKLTALLLALLLWFYVSGPGWAIPGFGEAEQERIVINLALEKENLPETLEVKFLPENVNVGLFAPEYTEEEVKEILRAYLDLEQVVSGTFWLPVVLDNPRGWEIEYISPQGMQVVIEEKGQ